MKPIINNEWDFKYWRETWTMPIGSILNSFAVCNQGKGISAQDYMRVVDLAYAKAQELVDKSILKVQEEKRLSPKEIEYKIEEIKSQQHYDNQR